MKTPTMMAVLSMAAAMLAAEYTKPTGDWNTWHGALSGKDVQGDRNVFVGAGAGGEADSPSRCTFIGAGAGALSTNCTDCVFIGYRAGRGASRDADSIEHATSINGHFYADPYCFWINCGTNRWMGEDQYAAPIYYSARSPGALTFNTDVHIAGGSLTVGYGDPAAEAGAATLTSENLATLLTNMYTKAEVYALVTNEIYKALHPNN